MSNNQAKLLLELAKKIKSEPKNRSQIIATLTSAKILTKEGALTNHYPHLRKAVSTLK